MTAPEQERTTAVVVTWRGRDHLAACLDALVLQRSHRLLVVDNASDDGTSGILAEHPSRPEVLRSSRNLGYAGGMSLALEHVRTPFTAWINDDAAPEPDWLAELEGALDSTPRAAAASSVLTGPDGATQSTGVRLTRDGHGADSTRTPVFGFCGGAALLRTEQLRAVGGVPAEFFCYYEDTDTSWRLRLAGYGIVPVPGARVTHLHGASTRPGSARFHRWNERNRLLMLLRCAPVRIAARELARFAALTLALPLRRAFGRPAPDAANFRFGPRLRVLAEVVLGLPRALRTRRGLDRTTTRRVWQEWAGQ